MNLFADLVIDFIREAFREGTKAATARLWTLGDGNYVAIEPAVFGQWVYVDVVSGSLSASVMWPLVDAAAFYAAPAVTEAVAS